MLKKAQTILSNGIDFLYETEGEKLHPWGMILIFYGIIALTIFLGVNGFFGNPY